MSLRNKIDAMIKAWNANAVTLEYKSNLFDIYEGDLRPYIVNELEKTLGKESKSFGFACQRIPPINVLKKIVSKLSQIYNAAPSRKIEDGTESDQALLNEYITQFNFDSQMDVANEFYNLTKICFIMPVFNKVTKKVALTILLPHEFLPFNSDPSDRMRMTELMTFQGKVDNKKHFYAYDKDEFVHFDEDGKIFPDDVGGVNIYGAIPGTYIRKSRNLLYPKDDTDMKAMTLLIPTMLADLNLASMFSCFSIIWAINISDGELKYAPNAVWHLKSDGNSDAKPDIGTIKPEADIEQTINLIVSEFSMWLNSKGIKPGSIGDLNAENMASGISKIIDEMDTFEDREKQAMVFGKAEESDLWPLIMHKMHPAWVNQGMETNKLFSPNATVCVQFPEQQALKSRSDLVTDLKAEVDAGFMSRRRAVEKLNPGASPEEIDKLIAEIEAESGTPIAEAV